MAKHRDSRGAPHMLHGHDQECPFVSLRRVPSIHIPQSCQECASQVVNDAVGKPLRGLT